MISSNGFFELKSENNEALISYLQKHKSIKEVKEANGLITAFLNESVSASAFNKELLSNNIPISHFVMRKESLEEQFLQLTDNLN